MLKKFFTGLMAAGMLLATSCQEQEFTPALGEATVTFEVTTPEIATRAYSDGTHATELQYAVYHMYNGQYGTMSHETSRETTVAEIHGSTTLSLQLTAGETYRIILWAAAPNAPYTLDFDNKTMTVNYTGAVCNDESRDAFYAVHEFTVNGTQTETVELRRPFAQLNIGTNDYQKAKDASGYEPTESSVKVKGIYNTLNLADGTVSGGDDEYVTFNSELIPTGETFPVTGFQYVAMNYVLVRADKSLVDVTFTLTDGTTDKTRTVSSVPVQRNYRTNIYGSILTSDVDINVEIAPEYNEPSIGYIFETDATTGQVTAIVETASGMATIAEEIANGNIESNVDIVLDGDIDLSELTALTRSAIVNNWNPIGTEEAPFTGTFDGKGYTIKNLTLVESEAKEGKAFIGFFGYAKNATIKNVTFENVYINIPCLDIDHSQGHIGAVAGSLEGTSTIENVTVKGDIKVYATQDANGASRVAVVAGGNSYGNVTMKNVHVIANEGSYLKANNNTGALAGQLQGKMVFENCSSNIDVTVNKFFAGGLVGIAAGDSYFNNCHTTGDVAVVAGREGRHNDQYRVGGIAGGWADGATKVCTLEDCTYTGNVSGKNADGAVADPLDYWGYVGRGYTLANCEGSKVIIDGTEFVQVGNSAPYGNYTINGLTPVTTADELVAALRNPEVSTIQLGAGEYTLDLYASEHSKESLTILGSKGTKVKFADKQVRMEIYHQFTIHNCEILHMAEKTWGMLVFSTGKPNGVYTVSNCTFNGVNTQGIYINEVNSTATYNIENCTFNGNFGVGHDGAITIQTNKDVEFTVNVMGCEFNDIPDNCNRIYLAPSSPQGLFYDLNLNTDLKATTAYEIETFLKLGFKTINLADGNYEMPQVDLRGKELTLVGSKQAVIDASKIDARNQFVTGATLAFEGLTLNFGRDNYMGFANTASLTYKDCAINGLQFLYGDASFEGCKFNSQAAEHSVWTYGAKNVNFTDCDFTYGDRCVNCYNDNDIPGGKQTVNFTNCKFTTANTGSRGAVEINSCFFSVGIEVNLTSCTAPAYGQMAYVSEWDSTNGAKTIINIQ